MKEIIVRDGSLFQRDTARFSKDVVKLSILNGVEVFDVALSATTTNISHGLGRAYKGYLVFKQNANQTVYYDSTSTADPKSFLPLKASGAVTVSLWIF